MKDAQNNPSGKASDHGYADNTPEANAYNKAKANFDAGIKNSDQLDNNGGKADQQSPAYKAGQAANKGISDAQAGSNTPNPYTTDPERSAYDNAKNNYIAGNTGKDVPNFTPTSDSDAYKAGQAAKAGQNDAQAGNTNNQGNYPTDPEKTAYKKAQDAYKAGVNGDSQSVQAKGDSSANKAGLANQPSPSTPNNSDNKSGDAGSTDFINNKNPQTNFENTNDKNDYDGAYNATKQGFNDGATNKHYDNGFEAGINNQIQGNDLSKYYGDGYKAGHDGLAGINDAKKDYQLNNSGSDSYKNGYQGYKAGEQAAKRSAKDSKYSKNDLVDKGIVYSYAYKQAVKNENRRQNNLGAKAGYELAKKSHVYPSNLSSKHSQAYINAYTKAYRKELARRMPRYVYNLKGMFKHSASKFTKATRVEGYKKLPRYSAHLFKVEGISYSNSGLPRYIVRGGGMITANSDYVANAYYQSNHNQFRIIKPKGALVHTSKNFTNKNAVKKLNKNDIVHVKQVVKYHGITRFYIGNSKYVTSNKTYIQKLNK